jgi:hypothetical protein
LCDGLFLIDEIQCSCSLNFTITMLLVWLI